MAGPNDVNRIQNQIVTAVIVVGVLIFIAIGIAAANQKHEPTEYGCVYDPRDGSKSCLHAP